MRECAFGYLAQQGAGLLGLIICSCTWLVCCSSILQHSIALSFAGAAFARRGPPVLRMLVHEECVQIVHRQYRRDFSLYYVASLVYRQPVEYLLVNFSRLILINNSYRKVKGPLQNKITRLPRSFYLQLCGRCLVKHEHFAIYYGVSPLTICRISELIFASAIVFLLCKILRPITKRALLK